MTTAGLVACGRSRSADTADSLHVSLDTAAGARAARFVVEGLSARELDALRRIAWSDDDWHRLWTITVADGGPTPMAGRYVVENGALHFRPAFPLDPGRAYRSRFDPPALPTPRPGAAISAALALAPKAPTTPTMVVGMFPSTDTLPENQLRLYVAFSAPMSRAGGIEFVKLIDADGREVRNAFLPLDADFWNADRTRYTIFLDPGRVKRGILPNEQMGRALRSGRAYSIAIDPRWRDAEGQALAAPYRRVYRVGRADESPIAIGAWRVRAPAAGTREPLIVEFPEPLDRGLLERALGVESANGAIDGTVAIDPGERAWRFTPRSTWRAGRYAVVVLSILEDRAGNRIGRAFEVDLFTRVDSVSAPERYTIPLLVR